MELQKDTVRERDRDRQRQTETEKRVDKEGEVGEVQCCLETGGKRSSTVE